MNHQSKLMLLPSSSDYGTREGQQRPTRQVLKRQSCNPPNKYALMSYLFGMIGGLAIFLPPLTISWIIEPLFHNSGGYLSLSHLTLTTVVLFALQVDLLALPSLLPCILGVFFGEKAKRLGSPKGRVNHDILMLYISPSYIFLIMSFSFFVLISILSMRP